MAQGKRAKKADTNEKSISQVLDEAEKSGLEIPEKTTALAIGANGKQIEVVDAEWKVIDAAVTAEIVQAMSGVFVTEVVYNKPVSSSSGKIEWKACDRMPNGYCYFRSKKIKHIHIIGIGIAGAMIAMNVYGGLQVSIPEMPQLINFGDRPFWVCQATIVDKFRGNSLTRWMFEAYLKSRRDGGLYEDEHAMHTVQSKIIRNLVLHTVPQPIQNVWKQNYLDGKPPFDAQTIIDLGFRTPEQVGQGSSVTSPGLPPPTPPPEKEKKKPDKDKPKKETPATPGQKDLETCCKEMAKRAGVEAGEILTWTAVAFEEPGNATLCLVQALGNDKQFAARIEQFKEWKKAQEEIPDLDKDQPEMKL